MKLIFLGSGSAFTVGVNNFQANMLLVAENKQKLLIDCGSDIRFSLHQAGYSYQDITDIYLSHLHSDHAGGLEYVGFNRKFDPHCDRSKLYLHPELVEPLWQNTLSGSMGFLPEEPATLASYFDIVTASAQQQFSWESIQFQLVKVLHIQDYQGSLMPSYGLFFTLNQQKILLTSDTQFCLSHLAPFYQQADLIFQDCEITPHLTKVHAHYQQLVTLDQSIKQKMWLYGYQPGELPQAEQDGFIGFVKCGQVFDF